VFDLGVGSGKILLTGLSCVIVLSTGSELLIWGIVSGKILLTGLSRVVVLSTGCECLMRAFPVATYYPLPLCQLIQAARQAFEMLLKLPSSLVREQSFSSRVIIIYVIIYQIILPPHCQVIRLGSGQLHLSCPSSASDTFMLSCNKPGISFSFLAFF